MSTYKQELAEALKCSQVWTKPQFKDTDIYLDAVEISSYHVLDTKLKNIIKTRNYSLPPLYQVSAFDIQHEKWCLDFQSLLQLYPHSLVILVSCSAKDHNAAARIHKASIIGKPSNCFYGPLAVMLKAATKFPRIKICYTNNYVENEIVHIAELNTDSRPIILVSKFPDVIRFNGTNKNQVFLCRQYTNIARQRPALLHSVSECQSLLSPTSILHPPFEYSKLKYEFNQYRRYEVYNLMIYGKTAKKLFYLMHYSWRGRDYPQPCDFIAISTHLLKTFFGLFIELFMNPGDLETKEVRIWHLSKGEYVCMPIHPYENKVLERALKEVTSMSLPDLFKMEFNRSINGELSLKHFHAINNMLTDVCKGKLILETHARINDELGLATCMAFLRNFLQAVDLIDEVYGIFNIAKVKFDCTTLRLRSYLMDPTVDVKELTQVNP